MVEHGAALDAARVAAVAALDQRLEEAPDSVFARAALALEGRRSNRRHLPMRWPWDAGAMRRRGGRWSGRTGRPVRDPCRQGAGGGAMFDGEQKALLLGIVLAHADLVTEQRGLPPVLLAGRGGGASRSVAPRRAVRAAGGAGAGVDDRDRARVVYGCAGGGDAG